MSQTQTRTMVLTYEDVEQAHYTDAESDDGEIQEDVTIVLEKDDWPLIFDVQTPAVIRVDISVEAM